jgi:hypothetical protein
LPAAFETRRENRESADPTSEGFEAVLGDESVEEAPQQREVLGAQLSDGAEALTEGVPGSSDGRRGLSSTRR